jgi:hypothetical protein
MRAAMRGPAEALGFELPDWTGFNLILTHPCCSHSLLWGIGIHYNRRCRGVNAAPCSVDVPWQKHVTASLRELLATNDHILDPFAAAMLVTTLEAQLAERS